MKEQGTKAEPDPNLTLTLLFASPNIKSNARGTTRRVP